MAKKKTIIEETVPDGTTADGLNLESVTWDSDEDEILSKIKSQYGGSLVKTKVYKVMPGKSQPVFCFQSEENVNEEELQELYGGGKYALRFFVDGILKHTHFLEVADKPAKASNGVNGNDPSMIQNQMLRDQLAWNQQMILALLGKPTPAIPNTPMSELVQAWTMLNGTPRNESNFDKMIDLFSKGMEIGAGKSGDMDWKTALIQTVKELAPSLTQIAVASQHTASSNGMPGSMSNPNPIPQTTMLPDQVLKEGLAFLKQKILAGLPVGLALDWVVTNAADYQQFISIAMSKTFEDIVKLDNDLANEPFNSWLREFLKGLQAHFKEAATSEEDEPES